MRNLIITLALVILGGHVAGARSATPADKPAGADNAYQRHLYLVATAHLDTQWRWTVRETIEDYIPKTFRVNARHFENFEDYVFSFEGAFRYMLLREYYPDYYERLRARDDQDPRKEEIRLHHLLTMQTGIETTSFGNYGAWVASSDWAWDQLRRPMECDPGDCHAYSTGTSHLLSVILTRQSGKSLRRYMRDALFGPLGIPLGEWDRDPQGNYLGGNNMPLRPRDMLKLGQLFVDGGRYEGRQLVPEAWIEESWTPRGTSPWNRHRFGYLWWTDRWGGETAYFAWGYGGQFIVVVPRLDLVIVATSSLAQTARGNSRRLWRFFDRSVVPAFRTG